MIWLIRTGITGINPPIFTHHLSQNQGGEGMIVCPAVPSPIRLKLKIVRSRPATSLRRPFPKEITHTAGQGGQGGGQGNDQGQKREFLRLVRVVRAYTIKLL